MQKQADHIGRILLAEDDEINAELFGMTLEQAGYSVRYASNGESALEALREDKFDCVLMDIEMSVLNGLEATRSIRNGKAGALNRTIPIIGMSAHEGELVSQFINAGVSTFLYKPVELELLEDTVAKLILGVPFKKNDTRTKTSIPPASTSLDRKGALKRLKNNEKLLDIITLQVLAEAENQLQVFRKNLSLADYEAVSEAAHRYAGSLASIGAMTGSLICREIMTLARRGFTNHLEKLVDRLEQELNVVRLLVEES